MKKLCLLCNGYGSYFRGSERYTEELHKLLKKDYEIDIVSAQTLGTKKRDAFHLPWRNGKAYLESYYFGKKWNSTSTKEYDLILNNAGFPGSYWCYKYRKRTNTPFITFERGGGREESLNYFFDPDLMVFLTEVSKSKANYKKKVHLPIGIDTKKYLKKRPPLDFDSPIFFSPSAMVTFKHIELIIEALASYGRGSLVQTSAGDSEPEIRKTGQGLLGDRFHLLGRVEDDILISLYQNSDYLVSASWREAFGIIYLEAMATGLTIIAQDDPKRREIIGRAGVFVDWRDTDSVVEVINQLEQNPLDDEKIREQAMKYDWSVLKPKYIEVIESCL